MRSSKLLGAFLAWSALVAAAAPGDSKAEEQARSATLEAALRLIQAGQAQKAADTVDPVLAQYEKLYANEKRAVYCGMNLVQTMLYMTIAATAKKDAVAIDPGLCNALFVKGFALVDLGRIDEAQAVFERLVTLAPDNARYHSELGNVFRVRKQWDKALEAYRLAEETAEFANDDRKIPERCVALRGQGYALVEQGRLDEAEARYRKCLAIDPNDDKSMGELEYIKRQRAKTG